MTRSGEKPWPLKYPNNDAIIMVKLVMKKSMAIYGRSYDTETGHIFSMPEK